MTSSIYSSTQETEFHITSSPSHHHITGTQN